MSKNKKIWSLMTAEEKIKLIDGLIKSYIF